jgi:glycyl-tRNA synthetase
MTQFYDNLMGVCFKRGIVYPSSEIHSPPAGFFDYGSVGSKIKNSWENYWRYYFLKYLDEPFFEIDTANIMPESVFRASGHLEHFEDPVAECSKCGLADRADQIIENQLKKSFEGLSPKELDALIRKHNIRCPKCKGELKEVGVINLMFGFPLGAYSGAKGYLRPETAQGAYVAFKREYGVNREKLPLGIAIVGRAYRNEISPRQGLFRTREFSQAELQIFFDPADKKHPRFNEVADYKIRVALADSRDRGIQELTCKELSKHHPQNFVYYLARVQQFYESLGLENKIRIYEKNKEERAFYNKIHFDVEVDFESYGAFKEVTGVHYRTDYDLSRHANATKQDLTINKGGKKFIPHVIELSFGVDRNVLALLDTNFRKNKRTYFSLPPQVSPYIAGVYDLVSKDGLLEKACEIYNHLKKEFDVFIDSSGSIGRRYARADEIGVPFGITVDYDTIKDRTVTLRDRDSTKQVRVKIESLPGLLRELLLGNIEFEHIKQ